MRFTDPHTLQQEAGAVEEIEKQSMDRVVTALANYSDRADKAFDHATDIYPHSPKTGNSRSQKDPARAIAEDVTELALSRDGLVSEDVLLSGRTDHKLVRYLDSPHEKSKIRQALFIDSKAEKETGRISMQRSQTTMDIEFQNQATREKYSQSGDLDSVISTPEGPALPTTIFVKYHYEGQDIDSFSLKELIVACVPHGYLQQKYNPNIQDTIWQKGRDAPTHDEDFRVRASLKELKQEESWRVQHIRTDRHQRRLSGI